MLLITGATGNNGSEILKALGGKARVRAMVREAPPSSRRMEGVEYVVADFDDAESVRRTLVGVERAFLVTPSSERVETQQLRFVQLAKEAGVKAVVYLSQLHARPDSPVRFLRYHAKVEDALARSGMAYTNLRPNLYMQGLLLFKQLIASKGKVMAPIGDAAVSAVDVRDIAAVTVAALTSRGHEGKTYDLTGPESLTHAQMATQLSEALGKPVEFEDISAEEMKQMLLSIHMPEWQVEGLIEDYEHYARGEAAAVSRSVEEITGARARDFRTFAEEFKDAFLA